MHFTTSFSSLIGSNFISLQPNVYYCEGLQFFNGREMTDDFMEQITTRYWKIRNKGK